MNSGKTRIKPVKWFFGGGVFLLLAATLASAQAGRGGINGLVTDPSGAAVTKAKVTALNHATGISESTVSTAAGLYSFVSLNPGNYAVTASAPNFETVARDNVTVSVDQVSTVNIALRVGSVNEVVTVTETSDLVDTDNSTVGQLIPAEVIDRVPLLTRDVFQLVQLSAGVLPANGTPNASDTLGIFNARPEIDVSSYTINGSLQGNVYYMLDGSPIGIAENNAASIIPAFQVPEDGVDEYRVETQNTPATYQSGGGGVISLASKSGGDKFHGDAFVYVRPNALAANDYFYKLNFPGQGTPDFYRYQEGGAISGPILRKKLFFFGDYEATQQKQYDGGGTFTVPTEAERTGDFSADGFTIYDPLLPDKADGTRQPFPGNKIPAADLNPIALEFAAQFPKPTGPGIPGNPYHPNNFSAPGLDPQNAQKFDIRMDYYQSEKQRIFGRVSFDRLFFSDANFFNNDYYSYYYQNITNARNVLLGDDLTLSPTSVLQLRYSFTRHYEDQTGDPRQLNVDIASLGFPTSLASQVRYRGLPVMNFGDGTVVGPWGHLPWTTQVGEIDYGAAAANRVDELQLRWFEHWLKGVDNGVEREPPVRLFSLGEGWVDLPAWPDRDDQQASLYLASSGRAALDPQSGRLADAPHAPGHDTLVFDPWRPTPSQGGHTSFPPGRFNRRAIDERSDVLTYTTAPLTADLRLAGAIAAELHVGADQPGFDLAATLSEVRPDGRVFNLADGFVRVTAGGAPMVVSLGAVCALIARGTALRLSLAAGAFPAFAVNAGDLSHPAATRLIDRRVIVLQVNHGAGQASCLQVGLA